VVHRSRRDRPLARRLQGSLAGGTVTTVAKGAPFADPSGLAVSSHGDAFIADTLATDLGHAQLLKLSAAPPAW